MLNPLKIEACEAVQGEKLHFVFLCFSESESLLLFIALQVYSRTHAMFVSVCLFLSDSKYIQGHPTEYFLSSVGMLAESILSQAVRPN